VQVNTPYEYLILPHGLLNYQSLFAGDNAMHNVPDDIDVQGTRIPLEARFVLQFLRFYCWLFFLRRFYVRFMADQKNTQKHNTFGE